VSNFGANTHAVRTGRIMEALIHETDLNIRFYQKQFQQNLFRLMVIEEIMKLKNDGKNDEHWHTTDFKSLFPVEKHMPSSHKTRQQEEFEFFCGPEGKKNSIRGIVSQAVKFRLKGEEKLRLNESEKKDLEAARATYEKDVKNAATADENERKAVEKYASDVLKNSENEIGARYISRLLSKTLQRQPTVLKFTYDDIRNFAEDLDQKDEKVMKEIIEQSLRNLHTSLKWLSRGDYRPDYLRLERKRKMVHQVFWRLNCRTGEDSVSAFEFQEIVWMCGDFECILQRMIFSAIRIHYPLRARKSIIKPCSEAEWFIQPWFVFEQRNDQDMMSKFGNAGDFVIYPAKTSSILKLLYIDENLKVVTLNIKNSVDESLFHVPKWNEKFFSLEYLVASKCSILRQPFVNPEMRTTFDVRGRDVTVRVDVFLSKILDKTKFGKLFSIASKSGSLGAFWTNPLEKIRHDGDPELFNILLNLCRYCSNSKDENLEGMVIPQRRPDSFYKMLNAEIEFWKMPYDIIEGKECVTLQFNAERKFTRVSEAVGKEIIEDSDSVDSMPINIVAGDDDDDDIAMFNEDEAKIGRTSSHEMSEEEIFDEYEDSDEEDERVVQEPIEMQDFAEEVFEGLPIFVKC